MLSVMNATAQASAASISGPKLDNRRVLAALVDLGIVLAGSLVILFAADALSGDSGEIRGALGAVILGWALYYHFAMESGDGQTVGKKLMKIRVVLADGRPAGMREIAVRTVLRVIDGIGGYIVGLVAMLATGQRRQRLGDLAAGTMVVDASATAYAPPAPVAAPVAEEVVEGEAVEDEPESITLPPRPAPPVTVADLAAPEAPAVPEMRPFDPPMAEDETVDHPEPVEEEPVAEVAVAEPVEDQPVAVEDEVEPVEDASVEPVEDQPLAVEEEVEPVEDEVAPVEDASVESVEDEPVEPVRLQPVEDAPVVPVALVAPVEDEPVAALTIVKDVEDDVVEDEPVAPLAVVEVDEAAGDEVAADELPDASTPSLEELANDVVAARADSDEEEPADEPMTLRSVETVSAIDLVMGAGDEDDSSEPDQAPEGPAAS
jgi:uncharacterized RDD family membrane protein YckC